MCEFAHVRETMYMHTLISEYEMIWRFLACGLDLKFYAYGLITYNIYIRSQGITQWLELLQLYSV